MKPLALLLALMAPPADPPLTDFGNEQVEKKVCGGLLEYIGTFQLAVLEGHEDGSVLLVYLKRHNKDLIEVVILKRRACGLPYEILSHQLQRRPKKACEPSEGSVCL